MTQTFYRSGSWPAEVQCGWPNVAGIHWWLERPGGDTRVVRVTLKVEDCETGEDLTVANEESNAVSAFLWCRDPWAFDSVHFDAQKWMADRAGAHYLKTPADERKEQGDAEEPGDEVFADE